MPARPPPYDPSLFALVRGGPHPGVFSIDAPLPSIDARCAELSRLVYRRYESDAGDRAELTTALARIGLSQWKPFEHAATHTQCLAARNPVTGQTLLVFRGSEHPRDFWLDFRALPDAWPGAGLVHRGFRDAFESVRQAIIDWVGPAALGQLIVTGHSLGAALATLAASAWQTQRLVTFGSPRVGDTEFAQSVPAGRAVRYVNCCDLVTEIPPAAFGVFKHVGERVYIDSEGRIRPGITRQNLVLDQLGARTAYVDTALRFGNAPTRGLADHIPINYVRAFFQRP